MPGQALAARVRGLLLHLERTAGCLEARPNIHDQGFALRV